MHIEYTAHAWDQMTRRQITQAEVEHVLRHPFLKGISRTTGNVIYLGRQKGRKIIVVVAPGSSPPRVITAGDL